MEQESVSSLRGVADDEVIHSYTVFLDCHENLRFSRNDKCICRPELVSGSYLFNKDTILFPD